jgi:hypothetical protein
MFDLGIGRFIAATNTAVAVDVPEAMLEVVEVVGEAIETGVEAVTAHCKPEARRRFGFLAFKRRG